MRTRDRREAQALAYLHIRRRASALELGAAAVRGEATSRLAWQAKERIGLALAAALVRRGLLRATRGNMFDLAV